MADRPHEDLADATRDRTRGAAAAGGAGCGAAGEGRLGWVGGAGHVVGLCQDGMETQARRGMPYDQILAYYCPTSKIKALYR